MLALIVSACIAVAIERYAANVGSIMKRIPWPTIVIAVVFIYTATDIMIEKSEGVVISTFFIGAIIGVSLISRVHRSEELRLIGFRFEDDDSKFGWDTLQHLEIPVLAPHRPGGRTLDEDERELRIWHHLDADIPVVFVEVSLGDTSDFFQEPVLDIRHEGGRYVIRVSHCTAVAPMIASMALTLNGTTKPVEVHFGASPFWQWEIPSRERALHVLHVLPPCSAARLSVSLRSERNHRHDQQEHRSTNASRAEEL